MDFFSKLSMTPECKHIKLLSLNVIKHYFIPTVTGHTFAEGLQNFKPCPSRLGLFDPYYKPERHLAFSRVQQMRCF